MFYIWFLWHFDLMEIDVDMPIRLWPCSQPTKEVFVSSFASNIIDKSAIMGIGRIK